MDIRGRVDFAAQISRTAGLPLPVHVSYDDFTEDILENRMLRTAAELLLSLPADPGAGPATTPATSRCSRRESSRLAEWRNAQAPPITRLNARYEPALRLAELILAKRVDQRTYWSRALDDVRLRHEQGLRGLRNRRRSATSMRRYGGDRARPGDSRTRSTRTARLRLKPDI